MAALVRYLYRLIFVLWLGGMVFFAAAVAPALFQPPMTPALAGGVVRPLLAVLDLAGLLAGPLLVLLAALQEGKVRRLRAGLLLAATALAAVSFFVVSPKMARLRDSAGDSISTLPLDNPIRREFGALHGVSSTLLLGEGILALIALGLWPEARRPEVHRETHSAL